VIHRSPEPGGPRSPTRCGLHSLARSVPLVVLYCSADCGGGRWPSPSRSTVRTRPRRDPAPGRHRSAAVSSAGSSGSAVAGRALWSPRGGGTGLVARGPESSVGSLWGDEAKRISRLLFHLPRHHRGTTLCGVEGSVPSGGRGSRFTSRPLNRSAWALAECATLRAWPGSGRSLLALGPRAGPPRLRAGRRATAVWPARWRP
jgi:hypothetical protein